MVEMGNFWLNSGLKSSNKESSNIFFLPEWNIDGGNKTIFRSSLSRSGGCHAACLPAFIIQTADPERQREGDRSEGASGCVCECVCVFEKVREREGEREWEDD